ncbi:MAG: hypothetical protein ACP5XB_16835, partial [Isosphaeraceae bacterium]
LDNIPEAEMELVEPIVENLLDPLPRRKHGKWQGVYVDRLIPKESAKTPTGKPARTVPGGQAMMGPGMMLSRPSAPRQFPPEVMMRSFDFSAMPGETYRYRARVVVFNIQYTHGQPEFLFSQWSQPTNAVKVP